MMLRRVKSLVAKRIQLKLASLANDRGIKFLLRLHEKLQFFTMGVIKVDERAEGGIHPKHWVTDFHQFFVDHISASDAVLDIGCAYGHVADKISRKAKYVKAVDIRPDAVEAAKEQFSRENLTFEVCNFLEMPTDEKFDVVIMSNLLEHVDDREECLRKAAMLGNKLLIRVPAADRDWMVAYRRSLGLEWRLHVDHRLEYTEDVLRKELERFGLRVTELFCRWGNYCCVAVPI
jgi:SAM-dependent methyltransferase